MKSNKNCRWTDFRKALPPTGVEIEILAFRSWPAKDARRTLFVSVENRDTRVMSFTGLDRSQFSNRLSRYFTCYYPDEARWRFPDGKTPSAQEIESGARRVARVLRLKKQYDQAIATSADRATIRAAAKLRKIAQMPVYRIRRVSCLTPGGSNYYHHADVIAPNWSCAMRAAREGRVNNWRHVDRFDSSDQAYMEFEFLYRVAEPKGAAVPLKKASTNWGTNPIKKLPFSRCLSFGRKAFSPVYPKIASAAHA